MSARIVTIVCTHCQQPYNYKAMLIDRFGLPTNCHNCNHPLPYPDPLGPTYKISDGQLAWRLQ